MVYSNLCGLRLKRLNPPEDAPSARKHKGRPARPLDKAKADLHPDSVATDCPHIPYPVQFDYHHCDVYQQTFASKGIKNGVIPTTDVHYSPSLLGIAVTDMELL